MPETLAGRAWVGGDLSWRAALDEEVADAMRNVLQTDDDHELRAQAAKVLAYREIATMPPSPARHARFVETVQSLLGA